jgi:DNA-binding transcriptional LysR family regulator
MLKKIDWEGQIGRRLKMRDLHVFFTVAQRGSMGKAAVELGVSPPTISEVISDLEHGLGVKLLDRSAQGVEPTMYGHALLRRGLAAFDELKQGIRDIEFLSDPTTGELRIGCTETISATILPQVISRFSRQYPGVALHFDDVGGSATEVLGPGLRERKYDCVIQRIVLPLPEEGLADDLNVEVLFDDNLIVAAGSNTRWARRRKIDLSELMGEPWILPPAGTWYHAFVSRLFQARGLEPPKPSLVTHSVALRTRLLTEGPYITTFASSIVRFQGEGYALTMLPVDFPTQALPAGLLTLKNRTLSPVVERFIVCAREVAKSLASRSSSGRRK